jgi:hypothetical protein
MEGEPMTSPISDPAAAHAQAAFDRAGLHDNVQLTEQQPAVSNHIEK